MKNYYVSLRSYDFVDMFYFETEEQAMNYFDELCWYYGQDEIEWGKVEK